MRLSAYIRVLGDEGTIRRINEEAKAADSAMRPLKARTGVGDEVWWQWSTKRTAIDVDRADEGLRTVLSSHRSIFPTIRKYKGPRIDIYLEVVSEYRENERPKALHLSAETISLLSELGGALDNDSVPLVGDPSLWE